MYGQIRTVSVTTDGSGDAVVYSPHILGRIEEIVYVKDDFAAGVDFAITLETTGRGVWTQADVNASTARRPRAACHDTVGAARFYNDGGDEPVIDHIVAANERVKFTIAQGGATKSGTFHLIVS